MKNSNTFIPLIKMTPIKYYFLCAFILIALSSFGQRRDTLTIYYPINNFQLHIEAQNQLSNAISAPGIKAIQVLGYADYLGSVGYNLRLSSERAEAVKAFLVKKNGTVSILANGKGQIDEAVQVKQGDPNARKVEIIIDYEKPTVAPPVVVAEPIAPKTPPDDSVNRYRFEARVDSLFKGQAGTSITLNELNFVGGRHFLTPKSNSYLPVLLNCLLQHSNIKIKIIGHICCDFNIKEGYDYDTRSYDLSKNRAKVIYDYLLAHGISSNRMQYKGVGSTRPKVYPEKTPEDSDLNRRAEIIIVGN